MSDLAPDRVTLRTPTDLLAAVPYLLGFHPIDSIVVLGLHGPRVVFNVRADLPDADAPLAPFAAELARLFEANDLDRALIVGYGPAPLVTRTVLAVGEVMAERGVCVAEILRVADGRYWSYLCTDSGCCAVEGTPFDPTATEVAAAATFAGRVALPDREALARTVAAPAGAELAASEEATRSAFAAVESAPAPRRRAGARALAAAVERHRAGRRLDDVEVARLSLFVAHTDVRDLAWRRLVDAGRAGVDQLEPHLALWGDVVRRARPDLAAAPAALLAAAAWRSGDGALAWVAVERALAETPGYGMALLLAEALTQGLPPEAMDVLATMAHEDDRRRAPGRRRGAGRHRERGRLRRGGVIGRRRSARGA